MCLRYLHYLLSELWVVTFRGKNELWPLYEYVSTPLTDQIQVLKCEGFVVSPRRQ